MSQEGQDSLGDAGISLLSNELFEMRTGGESRVAERIAYQHDFPPLLALPHGLPVDGFFEVANVVSESRCIHLNVPEQRHSADCGWRSSEPASRWSPTQS